MGVPGLWPLLAPTEVLPLAALPQRFGAGAEAAPRDDAAGPSGPSLFDPYHATATSSRPDSSSPPPFVLGIDVSAWIYHARASTGGANASLRLLLFRLLRLLSQPHLIPLFIFDGPLRPRAKRGSIRRVNDWGETKALKELLEALGMQWREAPGEAEAELAVLNQRGSVQGVMSDDVDALLFGARLLVRNWSSAISSAPSGGSDSSSRPSSPRKDTTAPPSSPRKQKSGGQATVAIFRSSQLSLADFKLDREGLILVALMSGGDYDAQGLVRCGVRIAIGLAAAGFGARLVAGFKRFSTAPSRSSYASSAGLPSPTMHSSWPAFRTEWLEDLRAELRSNASGFLSTRQVKLAASQAIQAFLSTPHALAVLSSYVYPLVSTAEEAAEPVNLGPVDLHALLRAIRVSLGWGEEACLRRCRSLIWEGIIVRQLEHDETTVAAPRAATSSSRPRAPAKPSRRRALHDSPTATRISDFFASASLSGAGGGSSSEPAAAEQEQEETHEQDASLSSAQKPRATLVDLHSTRQGASGLEVRVEWDVSAFVSHARRAISDSEDAWRAALAARKAAEAERAMFEDDDDSESEQGQRRVPKAVDHDATLRLWIPRELLCSSTETRAQLKTFERKRAEKEQDKADAERRKALRERQNGRAKSQSTLEAFLRPHKGAAATDAAGKTSGSSAGARRPRTPPSRRTGSVAAQASKAGPSARAPALLSSSSFDDDEPQLAAATPALSSSTALRRSSPSRVASSDEQAGQSESDSLAEAWARSPSPASQRLEDALLRRSGWPGTASSTTTSTSAAASASGATPRASARVTAPAMRAQPRPLASSNSDSDSDMSFPSLGTLHAAGSSRAQARSTTTAKTSASAARQDGRALPPPRKSPRKDAAQQSARASRADRAERDAPLSPQEASTRPSARAMAEAESGTSSSEFELVAAASTRAVNTPLAATPAQGKRAKKPRARVSQAIVLSDSD